MPTMTPEELQAAITRCVEKVRGAATELRGVRGILGFLRAAPAVVQWVEKFKQERELANQDAKTIAVEAILLLIPDRWVPDAAARPWVGWLVERAYAELKRRKLFGLR